MVFRKLFAKDLKVIEMKNRFTTFFDEFYYFADYLSEKGGKVKNRQVRQHHIEITWHSFCSV